MKKKRYRADDLTIEGCLKLAEAILRMTRRDALSVFGKEKMSSADKWLKAEIEGFVHGQRFAAICPKADPDAVLEAFEKDGRKMWEAKKKP